jgi:hypothetical protein
MYRTSYRHLSDYQGNLYFRSNDNKMLCYFLIIISRNYLTITITNKMLRYFRIIIFRNYLTITITNKMLCYFLIIISRIYLTITITNKMLCYFLIIIFRNYLTITITIANKMVLLPQDNIQKLPSNYNYNYLTSIRLCKQSYVKN